MKIRPLTALAAAIPFVSLALVAPAAQAAPTPLVKIPGNLSVLVPGPASTTQSVVGLTTGAAPSTRAATATFQVTYHGFSAPAKAAFQRAVTTWSNNVTSSVPIKVDATFQPLGSGILGSAGAMFFAKNIPGGTADTYYAAPLANKLAGQDLDTGQPDIIANFSSSFSNWSYASGAAPVGTYDFQSVVTHEIGHGLGFAGFGNVSGSTGSIRINGSPTAYDRFTENQAGKTMLTFADPSAALKTQFTSGALFFDSPKVLAANGGARARLYAPATWNAGSSYSHLDEVAFPKGNTNSLMTPQLSSGETIRQPGPVTKAVFAALGW